MILLGHNGAGKSTLINFYLGFYPFKDSHPYLEKLIKEAPIIDISSVGYAPEAALLEGELSAADYFELLAVNRQIHRYDIKAELLKVGLQVSKYQKINKYSKGMKQRLLLALALFGNQKTVILDEPTSGLDPFGRIEIEEYLLSFKTTREFIISTHSLEFAYRFEQEVWILADGEVRYKGRPDSLEGLRKLFFANRSKEAI